MISLSNLISMTNRFGNEAGHHLPEHLPSSERWFSRIALGTGYDVWLIYWPPGSSTGLHDHGGSIGAIKVVTGELLELRWVNDSIREKRWTDRVTHLVPERCIHDVRCEQSALSVHAYSPALTTMTFYETDMGTIRSVRTEGVE